MFDPAVSMQIETATIANCSPDWEWRKACEHEQRFNLWFIAKGEGVLESGNERFDLFPGACFLIRMWEKQHGWHNPQQTLVVPFIIFTLVDHSGQRIELSESALPPVRYRVRDMDFFSDVMKQAVYAYQESDSRAAVHWLRAALLLLRNSHRHSALTGLSMEQARKIEGVCRDISENPIERHAIEALAKRCHYSKDHFIRIFKKYKGITPGEFIIRTRLQYAETLLSFSDHSISRIAEILGYPDEFSFSRQFRRKRGISPALFRRS